MAQKLTADARKGALAKLAGWSEVRAATPSPRNSCSRISTRRSAS